MSAVGRSGRNLGVAMIAASNRPGRTSEWEVQLPWLADRADLFLAFPLPPAPCGAPVINPC